jgi:3'(2'),5'-bisphosphate nucleotidase
MKVTTMQETSAAVALLERLVPLIRDAGRVIMDIYATDFDVTQKGDASPVTQADQKAEEVILAGLAEIAPDIPVVAEESVAAGRIPDVKERFFLVDPLDGTKEFISRNGEFTVNIALIEHGVPVLGLVYAPAIGRLFGGARGAGAWLEDAHGRRSIACRPVPAEGLTVVASRSHGDETALDAFLAGRKVASRTNAGSSLKLCLVAAGEADLYPRLGRTMEWDIAAGDAVLRAAGGKVTVVADGQPLRYGKPGFDNPTSRPPVSDTSPPSHARGARLRRGFGRLSCVAWHGRGVGRIATLPALLDGWRLVPAARARAEGAQAVLAWGASPAPGAPRPGRPARVCRCCGWRMASCARWAWGRRAALSIVLDDQGIYYDAHGPSRLDALVRQPLTEAAARARTTCAGPGERPASPSTTTPANGPGDGARRRAGGGPDRRRCLDRRGDGRCPQLPAHAGGGAGRAPAARVWLKVHPDVVAGRKRGHFGTLSAGQRSRVTVLGEPVHPAGLLAQAAAVYVVSSQMGFEALLWGRPVRCFGMPFYAGWGLTRDELAAPARRAPVEWPALVHAALVDYPRYTDPETGGPTSPERLLDWMGLQRRQREQFPPELMAVGFSGWKRASLQRFLAGSRIRSGAPAEARRFAGPVVLWGRQAWPAAAWAGAAGGGRLSALGGPGGRSGAAPVLGDRWPRAALRRPPPVRSGASAGRRRIRRGPAAPGPCPARAAGGQRPEQVQRGDGGWQRPATDRPVVLVVGQVESDASLALGAPGLHTNLGLLQAVRRERPEAWIVYRPHPDVSARLRAPGQGEDTAARWCDEIAADPPITALLSQVDEVHVLTSLAGFEALLRRAGGVLGPALLCRLGLDRGPVAGAAAGRPRPGRARGGRCSATPPTSAGAPGTSPRPKGRWPNCCVGASRLACGPAPGIWARAWQVLRRAVLREVVAWRRRQVANECEISRFAPERKDSPLQARDGRPPGDA